MSVMFIVVTLHVITAAAWFGLALRLGSRARLALSLDRPAAVAVAQDGSRAVRLVGIFILLTFAFGLVAFFLGGGFEVYGPRYHTSLSLIVIAAAVHYAMVRPAWNTIEEEVSHDERDPGKSSSARKRVAMGTGINHLLWLTLTGLMLWRYVNL